MWGTDFVTHFQLPRWSVYYTLGWLTPLSIHPSIRSIIIECKSIRVPLIHYKIPRRQVNWKRVVLHFSCAVTFLLIYCHSLRPAAAASEFIIKSHWPQPASQTAKWRQQQSAHRVIGLLFISGNQRRTGVRLFKSEIAAQKTVSISVPRARWLVFKTTTTIIIDKSRQRSVKLFMKMPRENDSATANKTIHN